MRIPYALRTHQEVLEDFKSHEHGLTQTEAKLRLEKNGPNALPEPKVAGPFLTFLKQFSSPLILILLVAVAVLFFQKEHVDASIVLGVLIINAVIGVVHEGKSSQALASLKKLTNTTATVIRDGVHVIIPDQEVVVGDVVVLSEGNRIPADLRLLHVHGLTTNEAILTGETEAVHKTGEVLQKVDVVEKEHDDLPLFAQKNMAFKGTYVSGGSATGVVVATGVYTAMGAIYTELLQEDTEIPLKHDVDVLSKQIILLIIALAVGLLILAQIRNESMAHAAALAISLAVSIIPEGLPIVLTYVLATGVAAMAKRHVLVKHMQAVEALGRTKILAVDKTGTITKNELEVTEVCPASTLHQYLVEADGYSAKGSVTDLHGKKLHGEAVVPLAWLARTAAVCSNAKVHEKDGIWEVVGDPTEAALSVFAAKLGVERAEVEEHSLLIEDHGFDYTSKLHYVVHKYRGKYLLSAAGAPESLYHVAGLEGEKLQEIENIQHGMADKGLRVVALGHAVFEHHPDVKKHHKLSLDGIVGIQDTLHEEVAIMVKRLQKAGIRTVMITGDHARTAQALATEAGIFAEGDIVISGGQVDSMSESELVSAVPQATVFARVTPSHKMRIVQAFRAAGLTIAMTGDGVNDAPSLAAADLGVGMGLRGTDVAKEASDLVLLDDNLRSVVSAVEEGRSIYAAIQRVVTYLFAGTSSLLLTLIISILLWQYSPLQPSQVIWLNFVTDVLLVLALTSEPREKGLLDRTYHHPESLITGAMFRRIILMAVPVAVAALYAFTRHQDNLVYASSLVLTVLAACHWTNAWNARSDHTSLFKPHFLFANRPLIFTTLAAIILQLIALYVPFMQEALHTTPLFLKDWALVAGLILPVVIIEEIRKALARS